MMKKILNEAWRYWKWLCVAFVTSFILLLIATFVIQSLRSTTAPEIDPALECLDNGGRWNADELMCERAA